eukprot:1141135-Pelagomonas_calceolata.AAC.4
MKGVPRTNARYLLRSRGGHRATGSTQPQPQPLQLLPRSVTLASSFQDRDTPRHPSCGDQILRRHQAQESARGLQAATPRPLLRSFKGLSSSYPPYQIVRCGQAINLALKLHAHSVQHAYELASTSHALKNTSFNSCQQDQARATARTPPDPR